MAPEKGKRRTKTKKKTSKTTSPHSCPCPSGCNYSLSATGTHEACPICLGILHTRTALESPNSCSHCGRMSAVMRKRSAVALAIFIAKAAALKVARVTKLPAPEPVLEDVDLECSSQVGDDNVSDSSVSVEDSTPESSDQDADVELDFKQQEDKLQSLMKRLCPMDSKQCPALPYANEIFTSTPKRKSKTESKKHARWKLWFL